ncbi:hypothetical protein ACYFX5_09135 [Bremerella sp. T1]|uniref:hypothetical protein n=1 Tax=Bremerella sp. TYQ1 TaxID=3119568 RepID=UPI001CC94A32|nr:hypothetical protein [Bremerella volcania]UBM38416.1 hypothetical protein LA756_11070 [Bremerella volcania]
MSAASGGRYVAVIVNVVLFGVLTMVFGLWNLKLERLQNEQSERLTRIEENQKKIADAVNAGSNTSKKVQSKVEAVMQDFDQIKTGQERFSVETTNLQKVASESSSIANEAKQIAEALQEDRKALKSELVQLIRAELNSNSGPTVSTSTAPPTGKQTSAADDDAEFIAKAIRRVAKNPFREVYGLPNSKVRSKGFYLADSGEAFYVDRNSDTVLPAYTGEARKEYLNEITEMMSNAFRHNKSELEEAIIGSLRQSELEAFKATNISSKEPVKLEVVEGKPSYFESQCTVNARLSIGSVTKKFFISVPYTKIPGMKSLGLSTASPSNSNSNQATTLSDDDILSAISRQATGQAGVQKAYVFPQGKRKHLIFVQSESNQIYVIDTQKDLVLPVRGYVSSKDPLSDYQYDFKEVVQNTIEVAIDQHEKELFEFLLRKNHTAATTLENRSLSGTASTTVESANVNYANLFRSIAFPNTFPISVELKAGNLTETLRNDLTYKELPNMREISQ